MRTPAQQNTVGKLIVLHLVKNSLPFLQLYTACCPKPVDSSVRNSPLETHVDITLLHVPRSLKSPLPIFRLKFCVHFSYPSPLPFLHFIVVIIFGRKYKFLNPIVALLLSEHAFRNFYGSYTFVCDAVFV